MRPVVPLVAVACAALACNEGLQPVRAPSSCPTSFVGICGTVRLHGTLPDSTDAVFIVAYPAFPKSRNDLFLFVPLPPPSIPTSDSTYFYTLAIPNGRYEWLVAVWKKVGSFAIDFSNADSLLREAGYYRDKADTSKAGVVVVNGAGTDSINIVVDFTKMHPISFYFPAAVRP
jgi:hypothetical protein